MKNLIICFLQRGFLDFPGSKEARKVAKNLPPPYLSYNCGCVCVSVRNVMLHTKEKAKPRERGATNAYYNI